MEKGEESHGPCQIAVKGDAVSVLGKQPRGRPPGEYGSSEEVESNPQDTTHGYSPHDQEGRDVAAVDLVQLVGHENGQVMVPVIVVHESGVLEIVVQRPREGSLLSIEVSSLLLGAGA